VESLDGLVALVPVRKDSERVVNKNIRPFAKKNLLSIKLEQLKGISSVDAIVVSTDCKNMADIARSMGVGVHMRDPYFCKASTSMNDVWAYLGREFSQASIIMYCNVTNPLFNTELYENCIKTFYARDRVFDSLTTVTKINEFIWNDLGPVNHDLQNWPRSQDLPNWYVLNFAVNITTPQLMQERRNILGKNPLKFIVDKISAIDIDDEYDFHISESLYLLSKEENNA